MLQVLGVHLSGYQRAGRCGIAQGSSIRLVKLCDSREVSNSPRPYLAGLDAMSPQPFVEAIR